jgi:hypothetical protein
MGDAASSGTDMLAATNGAGLPGGPSKGGFSAAGGLSIASLGLGVFSSLTKGQATKASDEFQASKAERAAEFGKLQAGLTDSVMREQLNTTLSNIDVIRAAARTDPTSPTGAAIEAYDSKIANRQRTAALLSINSQVAEDEASAKYLRQAGDYAVSQSYLDAGIKVAGAIGKAFI